MEYRIGCSGWSYRHWRGDFYPKGVPARLWLEQYATQFDTVELNNSFYHLPDEDAVRGWRERTPEGFRFSAKMSRLITHNKRLANSEDLLRAFFHRMRGLGDRLGPVLHQLPPNFKRDDARLAAYLDQLPRDLTHAFEFRNESWWHDNVYALLHEHGASFCIYNLGRQTSPLIVTATEAYVRFHGPDESFASSYSDRQLERWAAALSGLPGVRRRWVYFNNDVGGHAPRDAMRLRQILRVNAS